MVLLCTHPCKERVGPSGVQLLSDPLGEHTSEAEEGSATDREPGVINFETRLNLPLFGAVLRTGEVLYLGPVNNATREELPCFVKARLTLHPNGLLIRPHNYEMPIVTFAWSPFTLVQACRLHTEQADNALRNHRLFKVSMFQFGLTGIFAVQGDDPETERARWVADIARAMRTFTQSLLPSYAIRTKPLPSAPWTNTRLLAGYLLMCDDGGVSQVYAELHCHWDGSAVWVCYDSEQCQNQVARLTILVDTCVSERVGIDCSCFGFDAHHFTARTAAEKRLWLRAISNCKVKLRHQAPNPTETDLHNFRSSIQDSAIAHDETAMIEAAPPMLPRKTKVAKTRSPLSKSVGPSFGSLPKVRRLEKEGFLEEVDDDPPPQDLGALQAPRKPEDLSLPVTDNVRLAFRGVEGVRASPCPVSVDSQADKLPPPHPTAQSMQRQGDRAASPEPQSPQRSFSPAPDREDAQVVSKVNQVAQVSGCSPRLPKSAGFRPPPTSAIAGVALGRVASAPGLECDIGDSWEVPPAPVPAAEGPHASLSSQPREVQPSSLAASLLMRTPSSPVLHGPMAEERAENGPFQSSADRRQQQQRYLEQQELNKETDQQMRLEMATALEMVMEAEARLDILEKKLAAAKEEKEEEETDRQCMSLGEADERPSLEAPESSATDERQAAYSKADDYWLRDLPDPLAETNTESTKSSEREVSSEDPEAREEEVMLL